MDSNQPAHSIFQPAALATLANYHALDDLRIFFQSLQLWNTPTVYLFCTNHVKEALRSFGYKGTIQVLVGLEVYEGLTRQQMETRPSRKGFPNLFYDFTQEKCALMEWALNSLSEVDKPRGVLFCDADLCWLGPIPEQLPWKHLGLSPHEIRQGDEDRYGKYNAGWLWMNSLDLVGAWRLACRTSTFFEQKALETLVDDKTFVYGSHINYGWWRMFQGKTSAEELQKLWSIRRDPDQKHSGLLVQGEPLVCIHTHWKTTDLTTREFNKWVATRLSLVRQQSKIKQLLTILKIKP
jgi:hypothetical protein